MILERETPVQTKKIGYFASAKWAKGRPNVLSIGHPVVGVRFEMIFVELTPEDYFTKEVQEWIQTLFTRLANMNKYDLTISVTP